MLTTQWLAIVIEKGPQADKRHTSDYSDDFHMVDRSALNGGIIYMF